MFLKQLSCLLCNFIAYFFAVDHPMTSAHGHVHREKGLEYMWGLFAPICYLLLMTQLLLGKSIIFGDYHSAHARQHH